MRLAQLTYTYWPVRGGADVYVHQLATLFHEQNYEQRIYQRAPDTSNSLPPGVRGLSNPLKRFGAEFWTQALSFTSLQRELAQYDILIGHYPHYTLVGCGARNAGRPVVIGLSHGVFWDDCPGALRSRLKRWISRLAFCRADFYVANDTHFLREMGLDIKPGQFSFSRISTGCNEQQSIWFIPNGVDTERFQAGSPNPSLADRHAILVPRHLYRNRGIHLAVEAFSRFVREHPETTLVIVGAVGQPAYARFVQQQVTALRLENQVVFWGSPPHEEMPSLYSAAAMTLIPSLCGEGTSLAALESMACGTATLSTDVAGLADLPTMKSRPEAEALAEAMSQAWPQRKEIAESQRKVVLGNFSLARWKETWLKVLEQAAQKLPR